MGGAANNDVGAKSNSSIGTGNTGVLVSNSILADVETSLYRVASNGVSTLSAEYSDFDAATITDNNTGGSGIISLGSGNVNVAPGFVNAAGGDFSLAASSPLIDAGDPAALAGDEPTTDLAGNPRVVDGNGDGSARRDIGAFEYQPPPPPTGDTTPPETIAGKFKKKAKAGKKAKFKFSSDDPAATFTCAYDDGSPKACTSPYTLKRLKKGKHTLTITAIDAAGNHDPTPVVDKFKVKKKKHRK